MTATMPPDVQQDRIATTVVALQGDLARTEGKASLLLALSGGSLVALVPASAGIHVTRPVAAAGCPGAAAMLAATLLLLLAVRPVLRGPGWTSWSGLSDEALRERLSSGYQVEHLAFLAGLAARKFRLIRAAVDCMVGALLLLALAAVLVVTT